MQMLNANPCHKGTGLQSNNSQNQTLFSDTAIGAFRGDTRSTPWDSSWGLIHVAHRNLGPYNVGHGIQASPFRHCTPPPVDVPDLT